MRHAGVRVVVCLGVGVVVNVLVAWGVPPLASSAWSGSVEEPVASAPTLSPSEYRFGVPIKVERKRGTHFGWTIREVAIARISRSELDAIYAQGLNRDDPLIAHVSVYDIGLPLRSLRMIDVGTAGRNSFAEVKAWAAAAGIRRGWVVRTQSPFRSQTAALPLQPLWPAFAANTMFYGVVAWCVMFAPGDVRRAWRRKRRRCVGCGYELAGLVKCPECGAETERREGKAEALTDASKEASTLPGGE